MELKTRVRMPNVYAFSFEVRQPAIFGRVVKFAKDWWRTKAEVYELGFDEERADILDAAMDIVTNGYAGAIKLNPDDHPPFIINHLVEHARSGRLMVFTIDIPDLQFSVAMYRLTDPLTSAYMNKHRIKIEGDDIRGQLQALHVAALNCMDSEMSADLLDIHSGFTKMLDFAERSKRVVKTVSHALKLNDILHGRAAAAQKHATQSIKDELDFKHASYRMRVEYHLQSMLSMVPN